MEFRLASEHCQQAFVLIPNLCSDSAILCGSFVAAAVLVVGCYLAVWGRMLPTLDPKPEDTGSTPLGNPAGALGASGLLLGSILGSSGLIPNQTYYMVKPAYVLLSVLFGILLVLGRFFPRRNLWVIAVLAVAVLAGVIGQLSTAALLGLEIQHSALETESPQASAIALVLVVLVVMVAVVVSECCSLIRNLQADRLAQQPHPASETTSGAGIPQTLKLASDS